MSYHQDPRCHPGAGCFTCPFPDCTYKGNARKEETAIAKNAIGWAIEKAAKGTKQKKSAC